jgi:ABC-2 type transport system ATP-binding protein
MLTMQCMEEAGCLADTITVLSGGKVVATGGADGLTITAQVDPSADLAIVVRALDEAVIEAAEPVIGEPTLDDVYRTLAATKLEHVR